MELDLKFNHHTYLLAAEKKMLAFKLSEFNYTEKKKKVGVPVPFKSIFCIYPPRVPHMLNN